MIRLTRLDDREVVINSDLVVMVEATPDTVVTLTTGDRILVKEGVEEVVERAVAFRHRVLQGPGGYGPPAEAPAFASRARHDASRGGDPGGQANDRDDGQVSAESADLKDTGRFGRNG